MGEAGRTREADERLPPRSVVTQKTMKNIFLLTIISIATVLQVQSQDDRSGMLDARESAIGISTGMDYSILPLKLTYKRGINLLDYEHPFVVGVDMTVPLFSPDLRDLRARIISEATLLRKGSFEVRAGIDPMLITVNMETEQMTSVGADFHVFTGITSENWNVGMELNYNRIFSTQITHTDHYREQVFIEVVDGWYRSTASNMRIGLLINRTIDRFDVYMNGGLSKTGTFNNYLFVPTMYALLGVSVRIPTRHR